MDEDAATRVLVQTQLFPDREEVVERVISFQRPRKKKKGTERIFLCLTLVNSKKGKAKLHCIEQGDDGTFRKPKDSWRLEDLTKVDGGDPSNELEFTLYFEKDKPQTWTAYSIEEKNIFLWTLCQLCEKYLQSYPELTRLDIMDLRVWVDTLSPTGKQGEGVQKAAPGASRAPSPVAAHLTKEEEAEINTLLAASGFSLGEVDKFVQKLQKDLAELDAATLKDILEGDVPVADLVSSMDSTTVLLDRVNDWLELQHQYLESVEEDIKEISDKNRILEVRSSNQTQLIDELARVLRLVDLTNEAIQLLEKGAFDDDASLPGIIKAAQTLQGLLSSQLDPATSSMEAIKEKRANIEKVREKFVARFSNFMSIWFRNKADQMVAAAKSKGERKVERLKEHIQTHRKLFVYAPLLQTLRQLDREKWHLLRHEYAVAMNRAYILEISGFFREVRHSLVKESPDNKLLAVPEESGKLKRSGTTESIASRMSDDSPRSMMSERSSSDRRLTIDKAFTYILAVLMPLFTAEERFIVTFFGLLVVPEAASQPDAVVVQRLKASPLEPNEIVDEAQLFQLMEEVLQGTLPEFQAFIDRADRTDHFYCINIVSDIEEYLGRLKRTESLLFVLLTDVRQRAHQRFLDFVDSQCSAINDQKPAGKHLGILEPFAKFPLFVERLESMTLNVRLRPVLDAAYVKLTTTMFEWLERTAASYPKYANVTRFENYHRYWTSMQRLSGRSTELDKFAQEASVRFDDAAQKYVIWIVEAELPTLMEFIRGLDKLLQTMPPEEVAFQSAFSKYAFRKIKSSIPSLEKAADSMVARMTNHLCSEEKLLPFIVMKLQGYFLERYRHLAALAQKCYPSEKLDQDPIAVDRKFTAIVSHLQGVG